MHGCSVDDLSHRLNRKKVGSNAKQFFLTGVAVLCPIARKNLVVVEVGCQSKHLVKMIFLTSPSATPLCKDNIFDKYIEEIGMLRDKVLH